MTILDYAHFFTFTLLRFLSLPLILIRRSKPNNDTNNNSTTPNNNHATAAIPENQIRVEDKLYSTEKLADLHPGGPLFIKVLL